MKSLIIHSLKMRKVQAITVLICVALSVCMCLALGLTYGGVTKGVTLSTQRGGSEIVVVPSDAMSQISETELLYTGVPAPIYMSASNFETVKNLPGINQASPQFYCQTLAGSCCSPDIESRIIGVDLETDFVVTPLLDQPIESLADDEVIIGESVLELGDGTIMALGEEFKVVGHMAKTGADMDGAIICNIDKARELAKKNPDAGDAWEKYGDPENLISGVMVNTTGDKEEKTKLLHEIKLSDDMRYIERSEAATMAFDQLRSVFLILGITAIVMVVITLLQLFARFYSCVWERKSELALYRAIGADSSALRKMIGGEIGILVGAGTILGVILGFAAQALLKGLLISDMAFPFVPMSIIGTIGLIIAIVVVYAILSAAAIAWPLKQIGNLDPSLAMQQGDID